MSHYIAETLRQQVAVRANFLCEYCLMHENDLPVGCEVDHIIGLKHGGPTEFSNLAFACLRCNRRKGTDLASVNWPNMQLVRLFNPRVDLWADHFHLVDVQLLGLTEIGEITVRIFGFNEPRRLAEREVLLKVGLYPSAEAMQIMQMKSR